MVCLAALFVLAAQAAVGQDRQSAAWLVFEKANAAMSSKEFGQALQLYKDAISMAGIFPEAELAVGDIYFEEGEIDLARTQYEKAYNLRSAFYIPDTRYDVLYKLADLYEVEELYNQMESSLGSIVDDDRRFAETSTYRLQTQVVKNYLDNGLDRILVLYSFEDSITARAHSKLGWFYYRTGRNTQAISHLLYSVIYRVTRMKTWLHDRDVDYQFTNLPDLLESIATTRDLASYADDTEFYKDLYYLAGATYADGYAQQAATLWRIISGSPLAGTYQGLSGKQLQKPAIEPLLTVNAKPPAG